MGRRRKAREVALQFLYQLDLNDDDDPTPPRLPSAVNEMA